MRASRPRGRETKSQIQALDRTQPILPMAPGLPERATHDYKRHGTSSLYAALDVSTGQVIGSLHGRHRAIEFKQFLQILDREVPGDLNVHVILDNSSTHKTPAIRRWLTTHPRFVLHFTPTAGLGDQGTRRHEARRLEGKSQLDVALPMLCGGAVEDLRGVIIPARQ